MQTKRFSNRPTKLRQGYIFNLKKVLFSKQKFIDLYPSVNLDSVQKAIILTQSCDLVQNKIPYINIALLEPLGSKAISSEIADDKLLRKTANFDNYTFYHTDSLYEDIANALTKLVQNRTEGNHYYFFLSINRKSKIDYFLINLTKAFPIRAEHYQNILYQVTHELQGEFKSLLGWKMASLYGRVGVPDYSDTELKKISNEILPKLITGLNNRISGKNIIEIKDKKIFGNLRSKINQLNQSSNNEAALKQEIMELMSLDLAK